MGGRNQGADEGGFYVVTFAVERSLAPTGDPSDYVFDVDGTVLLDREGTRTKVGTVAARVVRVGRARDEGVSVFEVFDSIDQSLHEFHAALFDPEEDEFKPDLVECADPDLLIIDTIELDEDHRGHRLGLLAALRVIETFGAGCGAVALCAAPIRRGLAASSPELGRVAREKLRRHWARLAFELVDTTDVMVLDLAYEHPSYEALGDG